MAELGGDMLTECSVLAAKFEGRRWSVSQGLSWDVGA